jgi:hypothetical protein
MRRRAPRSGTDSELAAWREGTHEVKDVSCWPTLSRSGPFDPEAFVCARSPSFSTSSSSSSEVARCAFRAGVADLTGLERLTGLDRAADFFGERLEGEGSGVGVGDGEAMEAALPSKEESASSSSTSSSDSSSASSSSLSSLRISVVARGSADSSAFASVSACESKDA